MMHLSHYVGPLLYRISNVVPISVILEMFGDMCVESVAIFWLFLGFLKNRLGNLSEKCGYFLAILR